MKAVFVTSMFWILVAMTGFNAAVGWWNINHTALVIAPADMQGSLDAMLVEASR